LKLKTHAGYFLKTAEIQSLTDWKESTVENLRGITQQGIDGGKYAAIAEGYIEIPEDGVYYLSTDLEEVWIDGKLLVDNGGEVKRFSRRDRSAALAKGLHPFKAVYLGHIIGGWPSWWGDGNIRIRRSDEEKFSRIKTVWKY
jgi:hexosaminidase